MNLYMYLFDTNLSTDLSDDDTPVDTALYILRDKDSSGSSLVTFTEQRDPKGVGVKL